MRLEKLDPRNIKQICGIIVAILFVALLSLFASSVRASQNSEPLNRAAESRIK
ncbi:MAG: hypothetical protein HY585_02750 [Candidatus Omnitrophica bacterium]|nr:hypothetical protein [Candidatus Omnitrophota bacterium]